MALVKCGNCSADMSANAQTCPRCGRPAKAVKFEQCRACSTPLDPRLYRPTELVGSIKDGTTTARNYARHVPCPKCGEPKPLASVLESPLGFVLVYLIVPTLLVWGVWIVFTKQIGLGAFTLPTTFEGWTLLFVPSIFVYVVAVLVSVIASGFLEKITKA